MKPVAAGRGGILTADAPPHRRGGLIFQARFEIQANRRLEHPRLVLSSGWLESMTLNTVTPGPIPKPRDADERIERNLRRERLTVEELEAGTINFISGGEEAPSIFNEDE